ncbi:MAG: YceI family protein, partial [Cryomorphaceae bacterium]|nr:YceI family protein [Cryomorphaceae bacterium]
GTIRVKSINTGISKRDKDLLKSGYFDEENFPKIIFIATSVKKLGDGKYEVSGKLKIKGVKKDHTFTVKEVKKSGVTYFEGEFSLNRRDFNVGGSSWVLSDDLIVKIRVQNK